MSIVIAIPRDIVIFLYYKVLKTTSQVLRKEYSEIFQRDIITDDEFIQLFKEISKHVLVKINPDIPPIFVVYTIHPYSKYLSSDSKSEFLRKVDRKNRTVKRSTSAVGKYKTQISGFSMYRVSVSNMLRNGF